MATCVGLYVSLNRCKSDLYVKKHKTQSSINAAAGSQRIEPQFRWYEEELLPAVRLREDGKYREAQRWLRDFLAGGSDRPNALALLSHVLLLDNKETESASVFSNLSATSLELPVVNCQCARLLLKRAEPVKALQKAQAAFAVESNNPEVGLVVAACLSANQRDPEALKLINGLLKQFPNFAEAYANRALLRYRVADINDAIKDARKSVSLKPHLSQMWALLGSLYYRIHDLSAAVESLRKALEGDASNKSYALNLSEFLRQDKKTAEAIVILKKAIKQNPKDAGLWTAIGTALQEEGDRKSAKQAYEKAIAIQPKSAIALGNLGLLELEAKNWSLALELLQGSLDVNPDSSKTLNNIGVTLKYMGKLFEAESSFKRAILVDPDNAEAYNNIGRILQECG